MEYLRQFISVNDYSALGDDSAAIQAAVDAAECGASVIHCCVLALNVLSC